MSDLPQEPEETQTHSGELHSAPDAPGVQATEAGGVSVETIAGEDEPALFANVFASEPLRQERIPHLGHVGLLVLMAACSLVIALLMARGAIFFHFFSVSTIESAQNDVRYSLGSQGLFYFVSLFIGWTFFPIIWQRPFFAGVHLNGFIALRSVGRLTSVSLLCFLLALVNGYLMPGPNDTPIDRVFRQPGAAWLLFGFGITVAPFFEELAFRGFLLPALCTAADWCREKFLGAPKGNVDAHGNPDWSLPAMVIGAGLTSLPFAYMHANQTGYSLGPFLLLYAISLVLCSVRLFTRSLAASVVVHAGYNFLLFAFMLVGTGGFKHLENM